MFYIYCLESIKNGELYFGFTKNLKNRLKEHNQKLNFSTKRYAPWKLIYYEASINENDARRREKYLKTSQGRRMMKIRLKEYLYNKRKI
jgi:putative endonuclease